VESFAYVQINTVITS